MLIQESVFTGDGYIFDGSFNVASPISDMTSTRNNVSGFPEFQSTCPSLLFRFINHMMMMDFNPNTHVMEYEYVGSVSKLPTDGSPCTPCATLKEVE